jgi:hypothetical protein
LNMKDKDLARLFENCWPNTLGSLFSDWKTKKIFDAWIFFLYRHDCCMVWDLWKLSKNIYCYWGHSVIIQFFIFAK